MISHRSAWNTVLDINRRFAVTAQDRMLALTPLGFDLSVYDLFGPFAVGGALVMPDAGTGRAPWHWAHLAEQHKVTLWNTVPALMEMLIGYLTGRRDRLPDKLRLVMMSGDWIPVSLPARIRALAPPDIDLISLGGATEASIWSIWHRITDVASGWVSIPYGKPLTNQRFEILDEALRRRPDWVPGEQYIGGTGVAMGYLRDEEKTRRSFITHPHTGERLYRTGDLGRYFPDGSIEFLGRDDFQVKIHGYRIELGEIEAALLGHDQVRAAVVTAIGKARGEKRLIAYITTHDTTGPNGAGADGETLVKAVREHIAGKLPAYMVPSHILFLDSLPLTSNGKVDRTALPLPVAARQTPGPEPTDPLENQVLGVWHDLLGAGVIGPDDDWCTVAVTPAQVVQAHHRLRRTVASSLPLAAMFTHRTARALATVVRNLPR
jgi:acyl-coenzyme A synthetase/AMP-(fatty) acid ligase